jgi:hypothetical protein
MASSSSSSSSSARVRPVSPTYSDSLDDDEGEDVKVDEGKYVIFKVGDQPVKFRRSDLARGGILGDSIFAEMDRSKIGSGMGKYIISDEDPELIRIIADWAANYTTDEAEDSDQSGFPWEKLYVRDDHGKRIREFCSRLDYYHVPKLPKRLFCDRYAILSAELFNREKNLVGIKLALELAPKPYYVVYSDTSYSRKTSIIAYGTEWAIMYKNERGGIRVELVYDTTPQYQSVESTDRISDPTAKTSFTTYMRPSAFKLSQSNPILSVFISPSKFESKIHNDRDDHYRRSFTGEISQNSTIELSDIVFKELINAIGNEPEFVKYAIPRFASYRHAYMAQSITDIYDWGFIQEVLTRHFNTDPELGGRSQTFNEQTSTPEKTGNLYFILKDIAREINERNEQKQREKTLLALKAKLELERAQEGKGELTSTDDAAEPGTKRKRVRVREPEPVAEARYDDDDAYDDAIYERFVAGNKRQLRR